MIEDNPQLGQIAVEELYNLPPETIKVNKLDLDGQHSFIINGMQIPAAQEGTPNEPPAKKQKARRLSSHSKDAPTSISTVRCEQTHQGEGWVDHLRRRGGSGLHGDVEEAMDLHGHVVIALAVDGDEERDNTESCERCNYYKRVSRFRSEGAIDIGMTRYEIVPTGQSGTRYQLPSRFSNLLHLEPSHDIGCASGDATFNLPTIQEGETGR
eukprot:g34595.t1